MSIDWLFCFFQLKMFYFAVHVVNPQFNIPNKFK